LIFLDVFIIFLSIAYCFIGAKNRFLMAKTSIDDLASSSPDNRMLIPLNQSLYVPGTLSSNQRVIVELGTGYFCEKSVGDAKEMIDRKVSPTP
jgi:prefoldin alpha subunit